MHARHYLTLQLLHMTRSYYWRTFFSSVLFYFYIYQKCPFVSFERGSYDPDQPQVF